MIGRYRLTKATLGVMTATQIATTIPVGAILEILVTPPEGSRMVDVIWDGHAMMIFTQDLWQRGEKIGAPAQENRKRFRTSA